MTFFANLHQQWRLVRQLYGRYTYSIFWLLVPGVLASVLEGLGVGALIPLFSFITGGEGLHFDVVSRFIHDLFDWINLPFNLWTLLIFIPSLFIFKAILMIIFSQWRAHIVSRYESEYRTGLYRDVLQADWPFLSTQKLGHIENTLMTDMGFTVVLLENLSEFLRTIANFLIFFGIALVISWPVTLMAVGSGAVLLLVFHPLLGRSRLYARYKSFLNKRIAHYINEQIIGLKTIKTHQVTEALAAQGGHFFEEIRRLRIKQVLVKNLTKFLIEPLLIILVISVFAFSYQRIDFNLAVFVAIIYLIQQLFQQIDKVQRLAHTILEAVVYAHNVYRLRNTAEGAQESTAPGRPFVLQRALTFRSVSFAYTSERQILHDINFTVPHGQVLAVVGPSGAGKTTLVDLLLRLLQPTDGEILIDAVSSQAIDLREWRRRVSYVPQEPFLINDTIRHNIRFYDSAVTDADIERAVKLAHLETVIARLPEGLDARVGERGTMLSGGERQRVVLARALARRPELLVLDEATSALDAESEQAIVQALGELQGQLTIVVVTHRPALTAIAQQVLSI